MSDRHLRTIAAAVVAGMLLLLSGCGDDPAPIAGTMGDPAEASDADADALAGAPSVGSCFKVSYLQTSASTNQANPISCSEGHTAMTYHVGLFPEGTKFADEKQAEKMCSRKLPGALGVKKDKMMGTIFEHRWYEPSATQWEAGGRWFRCDLVAVFNGKLRKLPDSSSNPLFYDGKAEDPYVRCLNSKGTTEDADYVTCNQKHDYRWMGYYRMPAKQKFPTQKDVLAWSQERCPKIVSTQNWWVTWPSESAWDAGEKVVSCYENTSS